MSEPAERLLQALKPGTVAWIEIKDGELPRVADLPLIAACLLSKRKKLPSNVGAFRTINKSWSQLDPRSQEKWLRSTKPLFNAVLRDFLKCFRPIRCEILEALNSPELRLVAYRQRVVDGRMEHTIKLVEKKPSVEIAVTPN